MKYLYILFSIVALSIGCRLNDQSYSSSIVKKIEAGTDSTYDRKYYNSSGRPLFSVLTHYSRAPVRVDVSYYNTPENRASEIVTHMLGARYGHYFEFYENGCLKHYAYYLGNGHTSYEQEYDSAGKLVTDLGDPYVDYMPDDKGRVTLYFSGVFFDSLSVLISADSLPQRKLKLLKSPEQAMLWEAKIPQKGAPYTLTISGKQLMTMENKTYTDTLRLRN